ncbi:MAG TPA: hypothetical protein VIY90_14695 [Steroidobacteraceae bacterium]
MLEEVQICTAASSATAGEACRGHVLISGSYGGEYNAYHAARWGVRAVVLNDAGVGKDRAGIRGLDYLERIGIAAATADARSCHIGDGDHMLGCGTISHVNAIAAGLGCRAGQTVRECAQHLRHAPLIMADLPPISGGKRHLVRERAGEPSVVCLDAAPLLTADDAGSIVITGSHAALFRGRPDGVIGPNVRAIFFSDAGVGLDAAGIKRLPTLDERGIVAGAAAADSAPIGDARAIYQDGVLSHVNSTAAAAGGRAGVRVRDFVESLLNRWRHVT